MSNVDDVVSKTSPDILSQSARNTAKDMQVIEALKDSMEAMIDDILLAFGSTALTQNDSFATGRAMFTSHGIEIGDQHCTIAILAYNLLALLAIIGLAIFSRLRSHSPAFNYTDADAMAAAVILGKDSEKTLEVQTLLSDWDGEPGYPSIGAMKTRFHEQQPQHLRKYNREQEKRE